ncbi:MAG: anti-sigma factor antagonist [Solirubrobacterales bacterium]|nr:anti-sigma factor antagonist [Solirubrobacterales bacterium]
MTLPPAFGLSARATEWGTVLAVRGELDLATAPALSRALDEAWAAGGDVRVDLHATTFVESTVLRVLLRGADRARAAGRRLEVVCARGGAPARLFALTGTEHLLAAA